MSKVIKNEFVETKAWGDLKHPRFMEFRCDFKKAKYAFNPILFEREDSFVKGAARGPSAILEASQVIEKYNINTDSKAYLSGFFTEEAQYAMSEEEQIDMVNKTVTNQISAGKIPVTLLGDGAGSIGAYYALTKVTRDVSILNIDAHLSLRKTMGGTKNHRMCKMTHAKNCSDNVLHFGVSSMGNNEKELFDPDKTFFADDLQTDKYWLEDVMCELREDVYISLDASIFDPSLLNSQNPDPSGINYKHVEKLLRSVAQKHNIVGVDISGFVPNKYDRSGELVLAKLIYDLISHMDS